MISAADIQFTSTYGAMSGVWFAVPCRPKTELAQRSNHPATVI